MNDKVKTLQIARYNTDYPVTLLYDNCKSGSSQYGPWNLYGVSYQEEAQGLFVDDQLHAMLRQYRKGDQVLIRRAQDLKGNLSWCVAPRALNLTPHSVLPDARTKDIHRQLCLKIAVMSFPRFIQHWDEAVLSELRSRTELLIKVLDGPVLSS